MSKKLAPLSAALLATGLVAAVPLSGPMPPADNQKLAHDIFRDIVEVRSVHDVGTKGVADILVKYLKAGGFSDSEINVVPETKYPRQVNVIVRIKGKGRGKPVMWICHMDVVDAKKEDWTPGLDPFKFTEKDGYFYGRGTSDMKDEDAAVAASLIRLKKEGYVPDRDIIVMFSADEEVGLEQDGPNFMVTQKRNLVDAGVVMNPDGGSGEIQNGKRRDFVVETSEKVYMTFKMETTDKGGHSSEPRPDNAIYQLAAGLTKLSQYQFPYKTNATTRAYFAAIATTASGQRKADLLALSKEPLNTALAARMAQEDTSINAVLHTTCVATMLKAGVQENALPSSADATIQCRVFPGETMEETRSTLEKVVADPGIKVTLLEPVESGPETVPDPKVMAKIAQVAHSMWPGVMIEPYMDAGASDSIFTRAAGIPSYGVGGGWNDVDDIRMHGRDERDEIGNFYQTVEFTYRLMKGLTSGN